MTIKLKIKKSDTSHLTCVNRCVSQSRFADNLLSYAKANPVQNITQLAEIKANLFPVWTYWGQCHYAGSTYNMFEVGRWRGGWCGPSRWAVRLLRAAEWERKKHASQQARRTKMCVFGGAAKSQLTHVDLHQTVGLTSLVLVVVSPINGLKNSHYAQRCSSTSAALSFPFV